MSGHSVVLDAVRTPIGRHGGALAGVRPDDLPAGVLRALLGRTPELDPAAVDDVYLGDADGVGEDYRNVARMALLLAGLPTSSATPWGARGPRILATPVWELRRRGGGDGLATMCVGVGQGIAVVLEAPPPAPGTSSRTGKDGP